MAISARLTRSVPEYSICLVRERRTRFKARTASSSEDCYQMFRKAFEGLDREHFAVITLDAKNRPIGFNVVSVGTLTLALVHPREVFKLSILQNAAGVIFAHNHISGDPTPSPEDRRLTSRLIAAGKILGVNVLDHLIFGRGCYISFGDKGWMEEWVE